MSATNSSNVLPRLGVVLLATAVAVAAWAVEVHGMKINLLVGSKAATATHVSLGSVIAAPLIAGLVAWGLLHLIERRSGNPGRVWTIVAVCGFVVSLLGPAGALTTSAKVGLMCLHALVALIVIVGLGRTASAAARTEVRAA